MSDIPPDFDPLTEKPLNTFDIKVIAHYVSSLNYPAMPQTDTEALDQALDNLERINLLEEKIKSLEAQHAKALQQAQATHVNAFNQFKADVIVTLKALELVAIASHRHGQIELNHKVRDARMSHLKSIIKNALLDFGDRRISYGYDDDF